VLHQAGGSTELKPWRQLGVCHQTIRWWVSLCCATPVLGAPLFIWSWWGGGIIHWPSVLDKLMGLVFLICFWYAYVSMCTWFNLISSWMAIFYLYKEVISPSHGLCWTDGGCLLAQRCRVILPQHLHAKWNKLLFYKMEPLRARQPESYYSIQYGVTLDQGTAWPSQTPLVYRSLQFRKLNLKKLSYKIENWETLL
jgi:hypothetical protein